MDLDRGALARIDRKLLASLGNDEAFRTLRVPATGAKWATWKRYCDAAGISMGRAVAALIDAELLSVSGEHASGEWPVLVKQATEELENREARIGAREHKVDTDEERMRERSERLRRWKNELEARELRAEFVSKIASFRSQPLQVVSCRDEECRFGIGPNPEEPDKGRYCVVDEFGEHQVEALDLAVEHHDASGQATHRELGCVQDRVRTGTRPQFRNLGHETGLVPVLETSPNLFRTGEHEMP
jgi:hypothetical protein